MMDKLTDFEIVMRKVKYLSYDEKVTLAKYLALTEGVKMYTPGDAKVVIEREVKLELAARASNLMVARVRD